jgi:hypothetical protein
MMVSPYYTLITLAVETHVVEGKITDSKNRGTPDGKFSGLPIDRPD